ncbi:LLM class flavin-dependent oxidoreductase [Pseudonocardia sp. MCCB 268]|nr:LLM class flavin-dependent oxidoreductase [Pseudonocardia cytotoxica]
MTTGTESEALHCSPLTATTRSRQRGRGHRHGIVAGLTSSGPPRRSQPDAVSLLGYLRLAPSGRDRLGDPAGSTRNHSHRDDGGRPGRAVRRRRFNLGLGASGPQVIEGFHGVPYDKPIGRTREIIQICRKVAARGEADQRRLLPDPAARRHSASASP